jgi:Transglutaminase-like superfamily
MAVRFGPLLKPTSFDDRSEAVSRQYDSVLPLAEVPRVPLHLVAKALWLLLKFDFVAKAHSFRGVYGRIDTCLTSSGSAENSDNRVIEEVCAAMAKACGYYPKTAACLQRSAALTWMLRQHGVPAELVVGVNQFPFKCHAWVEVRGCVVNDGQRVRESYLIIDRRRAE